MGVFYTQINIGTRTFNVTVDTGSTDLLVPIDGCDGCVPTAPAYDPIAPAEAMQKHVLASLQVVHPGRSGEHFCSFYDSYLTCDLSNLTALCSVSGKLYRDDVTLENLQRKTFCLVVLPSKAQTLTSSKRLTGFWAWLTNRWASQTASLRALWPKIKSQT